MIRMPFGKHRGELLSELPDGYVEWLGEKLPEWREPLRSALASELARRSGGPLGGTASGVATSPARTRSRRSSPRPPTPEPGAHTICGICGLGPTGQRPLVHAACLRAPF